MSIGGCAVGREELWLVKGCCTTSAQVVMRDRISGQPRGFGFVTFKEQESAATACKAAHYIDGRTVRGRKRFFGTGISGMIDLISIALPLPSAD